MIRQPMIRPMPILFAGLVALVGIHACQAAEASDSAKQLAEQILNDTGITGGLVVHLDCGDGQLTAALRANERYRVQGLDKNPKNVKAAQAYLQSQSEYGEVSVDQWRYDGLPYTDNVVNLIVSEHADPKLTDEINRVLAPHGVAYIKQDGKWTKTVKPRPEDIDDWTHYLHDSSGNAVSHDMVVGPPRHLQWIAGPRWSRHHDRMASMSALVSAGGRIFYIMDTGSRASIQLPSDWKLIARDAFNGTQLWQRSIDSWHNHLWPLKNGPTQLARRLVATDDRVYVTLGFEVPLTAIDADTGETVRTYEGTKNTEEVIYSDGVLFVLVNRGPSEMSTFTPKLNTGDQGRAYNQWSWNEQPREVMAVEADTGKVLWKKESLVAPLTMAADGDRVFFHDGDKIVCLDRSTGEAIWNSPPAARRLKIPLNFGPRLVLYGDAVLFAGGDRKMQAYSVFDGKELWSAPHDRSGYLSPEDLLVTGGMVWSAPTTSTGDSGKFTGRDPQTGEVKKEFAPDVDTYWFHHRCYIAKATDRFLIPSRTGIEFVDFEKEHWDINHWVRGGCLYGIMPCNGLVYTPPHNCACYTETKLFGFNALAPNTASRKPIEPLADDARLERGPAYGAEIASATASGDSDWPTYRGNNARSGYTGKTVPNDLKEKWQAQLGGKLSSLVVADGRVYVAKVDEHTLVALSENSGKTLWTFTAGGRVDSPPTIHEGHVLFGSADGAVYCVRASDGALIWRFFAALQDRRLIAFDQVESVWPVHGSILVQDETAYFVAGRSNFLDSGLRFYGVDVKTGEMRLETVINELDPETGENLQDRLQVLNMPVGLPDILSSDGKSIYMRSQQFDFAGNRIAIGPHSGDPVEQGSQQQGETAHLFSPTGYLDGTWFHRSYWVYGRSFAGGHAGYYQAGKFAPAGRILVFDDKSVYGFGRKPEYYTWTTTMEHQLFSASKQPQIIEDPVSQDKRRGKKKQDEWFRPRHPEHAWNQDIPLLVRAIVKADDTLFIAGPPDIVDEEKTFSRITEGSSEVQAELSAQNAAMNGERGALLQAVSAKDGSKLAEYNLSSLPVWDGMASANGRLFMSTSRGEVVCLDGPEGDK